MTEIPREAVEKLLLHAEAGVNKKGWDQPSFIAMLGWLPGQDRRLIMAPTPFKLGSPVGAYVEHYGEIMLGENPTTAEIAEVIGKDFFGFAVVSEGYSYAGSAEELRALQEAGKDMADVPGADEVRLVSAIDIHGRPYYIERIRGEKPIARLTAAGSAGGAIFTGLRMMVQSVVQKLPDNQENLKALAALALEQQNTNEHLTAETSRPGD